MAVNRQYINAYQTADPNLYQALTQMANFVDSLASAAGVSVGGGGQAGANAVAAPAAASLAVSAAGGQFAVTITNPTPTGGGTQPPIQHQLQSATSTNFDANSNTTTYTLGAAQTTLGVVAPQQALYWRLQSRYPGSNWNAWQTYANAAGVQALNAGPLEMGGPPAASATAGAATLPSAPYGFVEVNSAGTAYKVAVYKP